MTSVLIADHQPIYREGLKKILTETEGFLVIGEAATEPDAREQIRRLKPQVLLIDIAMTNPVRLETFGELRDQDSRLRILVLTALPEDQFAILCLRAGADGYLSKDAHLAQFLLAMRRVQAGGKYVSASLAERLALNTVQGIKGDPHETLSTRELAVMLRIAEGKKTGEIAEELGLSAKTISTYRSRILIKMNLRGNAEIVQYAIHHGLVD